jgi:predicted AlkP superfamily phosphohydrolase/phosphomutase
MICWEDFVDKKVLGKMIHHYHSKDEVYIVVASSKESISRKVLFLLKCWSETENGTAVLI